MQVDVVISQAVERFAALTFEVRRCFFLSALVQVRVAVWAEVSDVPRCLAQITGTVRAVLIDVRVLLAVVTRNITVVSAQDHF